MNIEEIAKNLYNYIRNPNKVITSIITVFLAILLFNSYLISDFSIKDFFEARSFIVLINLSEFIFHKYFIVLVVFFKILCFCFVIFLIAFFLQDKYSIFSKTINNLMACAFRLLKITWRLSTEIFILLFSYMMIYFGEDFIKRIINFERINEPKFTKELKMEIITYYSIEKAGYVRGNEIELIWFLLIFNFISIIIYILYRMFKKNSNFML